MFRKLLQGLSHRIPSQCAVCHSWPAQSVCEACVAQFAQPVPRCITCAIPLPQSMRQCGACIVNPPAVDRTLAAVSYAYPWSNLLVQFKFQEQIGWANTFATLLRSTPWVEPALEAADFLIPMPLSPERLRTRGFNQCVVLAKALDANKTRVNLLQRVMDTPAQSALPRNARLASVQHAFAPNPMEGQQLKGKRVVLLDDVMTTGASLNAAASALRQGGATHITAMVLARTE